MVPMQVENCWNKQIKSHCKKWKILEPRHQVIGGSIGVEKEQIGTGITSACLTTTEAGWLDWVIFKLLKMRRVIWEINEINLIWKCERNDVTGMFETSGKDRQWNMVVRGKEARETALPWGYTPTPLLRIHTTPLCIHVRLLEDTQQPPLSHLSTE